MSANVQSIEALKEFRIALCKFAEAARGSLGEAEADLQRHAFWVNDDRKPYWKAEIRKREENLRKAKLVLLEKKLQKTATGGRPSCVDEEKAVALAERRFQEAQIKSANTQRWSRKLDEQIFQYKGMIQSFNHALDVDVVNGLAWLDRMIESLQAYVALAPPEDLPPVDELTTADFAPVSRPAGPEGAEDEASEDSGDEKDKKGAESEGGAA